MRAASPGLDRPSPLFSATTERVGSVAVVSLSGELDLFSTPRAIAELDAALTTDTTAVIVDTAGVSFFAVAGLSVLLRLRNAALTHGITVRVVAPHRVVLRPMQITAVNQVFTLHATTNEALAAVPRQPA